MRAPTDNLLDCIAPDMMEGIVSVVAVEGSVAWLEPEQAGGCGNCTSSATCGATAGLGTVAKRLEVRRFPLASHPGLKIGDRVVVGVREGALVAAAMTAYALPLATMFAAGFLAQWWFGSDSATMAATCAGLAGGFAIASLQARNRSADGQMAPRILRRAGIGETCHQ
jgi:sigma-E factor negative regulatory protein RseC